MKRQENAPWQRRSLVGRESSPFDVGLGKVVSDEFVAGFSFSQSNLNSLIDHLIGAAGLLAKNHPSSCLRRLGVNILRGHRRTGLARIGARQAVRDGAFWTFPATFPSNKALYTPSAWMTRGKTQHAFGVDDTLLLLALATS
jgi:hypothetical protein